MAAYLFRCGCCSWGGCLLLLIFAASYLLLLWQPLLAAFVPGAANVLIPKRIDPILDQHMPKKEG